MRILLSEGVILNDLRHAIANNLLVKIYYDADKEGDKGERIIEPIALGRIRGTNNEVVRAWQRSGASHTKMFKKMREPLQDIPGYRMFRLDRIVTMRVLDDKFRTDKTFITQNRKKLNVKDKDMNTIYKHIDIQGRGVPSSYIFSNFINGLKNDYASKLTSAQKKILDKLDFDMFLKDYAKSSEADYDKFTSKEIRLRNIKVFVGRILFGTLRKMKNQTWYMNDKFTKYLK